MTDYKITAGNCGGGSPRFQINIDTKNVFVYLGAPPNFTGCTVDTWLTTEDFISSTDTVFDTSQLAGGVQYSTYAQALALLSGHSVTGIQLTADGGWAMAGGNQTVLFDNVKIGSDIYTFDPYPRSAVITGPSQGTTVSGMVGFTAYLNDDEAGPIQWAVRQGTCAVNTNTVFGNVDGHSDVATINTSDLSNQTFSFNGDMSAMTPGMYCFIYNPTEDGGELDIRLTSQFTLLDTQAPTVPQNLHWVNRSDGTVACGSTITDLVAGAVKADWDDSTDNSGVVDHYEYVSFNPPGGWPWPSLITGYLVTSSEYGDTGYTPSVGNYGFMVRAVDAAGNKSDWTDSTQTIENSCKIAFAEAPVLIGPPTNKDDCKNGGWMSFNNPIFKNQGACVSYVQANEHAGKRISE